MPIPKKSPARPLAIVGIILGILSLFILPIVFGTLATILGVVALMRATKKERRICYLAIAIGVIGLVLWAVMFLWILTQMA